MIRLERGSSYRGKQKWQPLSDTRRLERDSSEQYTAGLIPTPVRWDAVYRAICAVVIAVCRRIHKGHTGSIDPRWKSNSGKIYTDCLAVYTVAEWTDGAITIIERL